MNFTLTLMSYAPRFCLISLCARRVRAARKQQPRKLVWAASCFWISSLEFINKHNSGRNLLWRYQHFHEKNHRTQLPSPHLWELAAYEGYFWVFNSSGWKQKWIILAYPNYLGGEVVWSVLIYGWLQYTVIQIMKRALILKNTLYSPTGSWNAPNCKAQTNTKITATVPN